MAASQNQKEVVINQAFIELEAALTNPITIALPDADYTLNATEDGQALGNMAFLFTGTITANRNIIVPNNPKLYLVQNATNLSLGFGLTIKTALGAGATIPNTADQYTFVYCDGVAVTLAGTFGGSGTVTNTGGALTAHDVVLGNGGADAKPLGSVGVAGQVLTSNGAGADPSWQAGGGGGGGGSTVQTMRRQALITAQYNSSLPLFIGDNAGSLQGSTGFGNHPPNNYTTPQGFVTAYTPNAANTAFGVYGNAGQFLWNVGQNVSMASDVYVSTVGGVIPTDVRFFAGVIDSTSPGLVVSTNDNLGTAGNNFIGFRYSTAAGDANWQCITANGVAQTVTDSGIAADGKSHSFAFNVVAGTVTFYIDGTSVAVVSTHVPAAATNVSWVTSVAYNASSGAILGFGQVVLQSNV